MLFKPLPPDLKNFTVKPLQYFWLDKVSRRSDCDFGRAEDAETKVDRIGSMEMMHP